MDAIEELTAERRDIALDRLELVVQLYELLVTEIRKRIDVVARDDRVETLLEVSVDLGFVRLALVGGVPVTCKAMRILTRVAAAAALISFPLAACGGGSSTPSSLSGADVTVHAKDTLKFDKSEYTVKAGDVKIGYVNDGNIPHTLQIDGQPQFAKISLNSHGQSQIGEANLAPGTYQIYCDIPGHRAAGMQADLVVQ